MQRLRVFALLVLAAGCTHSGVEPSAIVLSTPTMLPPTDAVPPAEPELAGEHPVEYYVGLAVKRNPAVLAAERRVAAYAEEVPQVTALPDPMMETQFWPLPLNSLQTAGGRMIGSVVVSQRFPWFGKLRLRGEVAGREAAIALTELAEAELSVTEQTKSAYYDLLYYQNGVRITEENETLFEQYIQLAEAQYKVGRASQQDVLRAQVELARIRTDLVRLRQDFRTSQADMARLLSANPDTDLRAEPAPPPSVPEQADPLYNLAVAARPELKGRLLAIARDADRVELAKLDYYPDVNVGFVWSPMTQNQSLSPVADGRDNIGFGVSFNLPIQRGRLAAGVRQAAARQAESGWRYRAARDEALREVRRLTVQAKAVEEQIRLVRDDILPKAQQAFQVSEADYRVGKVDALQVISNFTELLRARLQLARLESLLGQTLAGLERAVGSELSRGSMNNGESLPPPRSSNNQEEPNLTMPAREE